MIGTVRYEFSACEGKLCDSIDLVKRTDLQIQSNYSYLFLI